MEGRGRRRLVRQCICYTCGALITFDENTRSENGKLIPLNPDKTPHDCPNSQYNIRKRRGQNTDAAAAA